MVGWIEVGPFLVTPPVGDSDPLRGSATKVQGIDAHMCDGMARHKMAAVWFDLMGRRQPGRPKRGTAGELRFRGLRNCRGWIAALTLCAVWMLTTATGIVFGMALGLNSETIGAETRMPSTTNANDPTARIDAKIYVGKHRVRMVLREFSDDLVWLHGMEPEDNGLFSAKQLREYYDLHRIFLSERIQVVDVNGQRLTGVLVDEAPYPFDDDLLQAGATEFHLVKRTMGFTYEFESPDVPLDVFTIKHQVVDDNFLYPAELSIELFQGESDLPLKAKLRVDTPMTVDLDWEQPVPALNASDEEKRAWLERQDQRLLGVTNFGAVYLWGYVEPRHLRVELLVPLNVLGSLFEIASEDPDFLSIQEMKQTDEKIRQYFSKGNEIRINDELVAPVIQRVDYFPADQRDFALRREIEQISLANGRVGISMLYPYRSLPTKIEVSWDKFSYAMNSVQGYLFYKDQVQTQLFSRQLTDNRLIWENPGDLTVPAKLEPLEVDRDNLRQESQVWGAYEWSVMCLGLVVAGLLSWRTAKTTLWGGAILGVLTLGLMWLGGWYMQSSFVERPAPMVAENVATSIASQLLERIYRSFDFVEEREIYEALEQSVAGPQLRDLYLQLLRDLKMEEQGGAISRIESVQVIEAMAVDGDQPRSIRGWQPVDGSGAKFRCRLRWNLAGLVEHWGHSHERTNQYQAVGTIVDHEGRWKLVDLSIESQETGTTKPRPSRFNRTKEAS